MKRRAGVVGRTEDPRSQGGGFESGVGVEEGGDVGGGGLAD